MDTTALRIEGNKTVAAINSREGLVHIESKAIVLAMGCRERARGAVSIPGSRPAGIFTAGTAQRLINMEGYLAGRKAVVFGSGDIGLVMARRMTLEGAHVVAVVERKSYSEGLTRNFVQCLQDYQIPLLLRRTITVIHGNARVKAVTLAQVDENKRTINGTEEYLTCDTVLLSRGLIPENELSKKAGIVLSPVTGGPIVNESMETSIRGIFACGNAAHVHDLVDGVTQESRKAGKSAANYLLNQPEEAGSLLQVRPGRGIRYVVPQEIRHANAQDKLEFFLRVDGIYKDAVLKVQVDGKTIKTFKKKYLTPGEMVTLPLAAADIAGDKLRELSIVLD